jgi:hypothetical protein
MADVAQRAEHALNGAARQSVRLDGFPIDVFFLDELPRLPEWLER